MCTNKISRISGTSLDFACRESLGDNDCRRLLQRRQAGFNEILLRSSFQKVIITSRNTTSNSPGMGKALKCLKVRRKTADYY